MTISPRLNDALVVCGTLVLIGSSAMATYADCWFTLASNRQQCLIDDNPLVDPPQVCIGDPVFTCGDVQCVNGECPCTSTFEVENRNVMSLFDAGGAVGRDDFELDGQVICMWIQTCDLGCQLGDCDGVAVLVAASCLDYRLKENVCGGG